MVHVCVCVCVSVCLSVCLYVCVSSLSCSCAWRTIKTQPSPQWNDPGGTQGWVDIVCVMVLCCVWCVYVCVSSLSCYCAWRTIKMRPSPWLNACNSATPPYHVISMSAASRASSIRWSTTWPQRMTPPAMILSGSARAESKVFVTITRTVTEAFRLYCAPSGRLQGVSVSWCQ